MSRQVVPPLSSLVPEMAVYSSQEVSRHCTPEDCWVIINNSVYDVSKYLEKHPGGVNLVMKSAGTYRLCVDFLCIRSIENVLEALHIVSSENRFNLIFSCILTICGVIVVGTDATGPFEAMYHSSRARGILETLKIGELDEKSKSSGGSLLNPYASGTARSGAAKGSGPYGLGAYDPKKPLSRLGGPGSSAPAPTRPAIDEVAWRRYEVLSIVKLTHDTSLFRFQIPNKARLNVGMGKHLSVGVTLNGKMSKRDYTPISDEPGYFEIMVKKYPDGPVSSYIHGLKVGDGALMRGLYGTLQVKPDHWKHLFMFAAGTGLAPMMPFIRYFAMTVSKETENDAASSTTASKSKSMPKIAQKIHLILSNKTEDDVLLQKELDRCVELGKGSFTLYLIFSQSIPPKNSSLSTGHSGPSIPTNGSATDAIYATDEIDALNSPSPATSPNASTHYGRISSEIIQHVSESARQAFQLESADSGPAEGTFALVCGPDGYVDSVKNLLRSDWKFQESNFHVF